MDDRILERRRFLQLFAMGSLTLPAAVLAGCTPGPGTGAGRTRPPRFHGGGGNGDKAGGGPGAKGSR